MQINNIKVMSSQKYLNLPSTNDDTLYFVESRVVVASYINGTSWYRLYSDGWKEQGGFVATNGAVTFPLPFSNTDYSLVFGSVGSNNGVPRATKALDKFTYSSANVAGCPANWVAYGF